MPIWKQDQARDTGGFAQVRNALVAFDADVLDIVDGSYPPKLDDEGQPMPGKEYVDVLCVNVVPKQVTEPLTMDISQRFSFRVTCSEAKTSFWVEKFLASADRFGLLMPDGIKGKRIAFVKDTQLANNPAYNYTNFVIAAVLGQATAAVVPPTVTVTIPPVAQPTVAQAAPAPVAPAPAPVAAPAPTVQAPLPDPMLVALGLAVGKTEAEFRAAADQEPSFVGSPFLQLAKAGAMTQTLVSEGKLVVGADGKYALPG